MGDKYLDKVAAMMLSPTSSAKGLGSIARSAKSFAGRAKFGLHSMAKTPLGQRIKDSLH